MPGTPPLRYHFAQLEALCRAHPLALKVVFVPTLQIGHNLGTHLSRALISWVNLYLTTPGAWAERLAGPSLRASGRRPLVQDADHFFMRNQVRKVSWPADHPLAAGYSAGGLADTYLRTMRGLRLAGVDPEELADARVALEGRRTFIDLFAAYCRWISSEKLYDRADLYRAAARIAASTASLASTQDGMLHAVDGAPSSPRDDAASRTAKNEAVYAVFDETPLPETAFKFVRSLSRDIYRIGRADYGMPAPQHSGHRRFAKADWYSAGGTTGPAGELHLGGVDGAAAEFVALREATGMENEVRGALRELLQGGIRLDEIEIVYSAEHPYLPLLVDTFDRLDLPASYAAGVPVVLTRTGQALIGFYRWIASGFDTEELAGLLRSRLLFFRREEGAPDLDPGRAAGILLEARVGHGRSSWREALGRYADRLSDQTIVQRDADRAGYRDAEVRRMITWMEEMHALVPDSGRIDLAEAAHAGVRFLDRMAERETERDRRTAESLTDRLLELADSPPTRGELAELASSLADLLRDHKVEAAVARPGHAYVVPLERAGYAGREHTVVVGLSEASFPGAATEDPILLDDERTRIGGDRLVLHRVRAGEPGWHLVRLLGAAPGRVLLTANRRDLTEGRETYPAAIFEQLKQQLGVMQPRVYQVVPNADDVLTADEAAMALRDVEGTMSAVLDASPWLASGLEAVRSRAADALGRYDGWLGHPTPELRPGPHLTLSASRLEELAACPYRYFLRNVLHVRPPDIPEDEPGRWLTPMEFGGLLHDVLRTFMETISARGEPVDADRHERVMEDVLDDAVGRMRERIPVRREAGYRADLRRLQRAVRVFLAEESRRTVRPFGFEVSFGMGETDGLAVADPVALRLSDEVAIRLRGSIDRVDEADGGYEVWDYKSGSVFDFEEMDLLSEGRRLQWALYAYVLDELLERSSLGGRTLRSGYFFTSDREHGLRLSDKPPPRNDVARTLSPLFDLVEQGAFLHIQKHDACTFCDYRSICATERIGKNQVQEATEATGDLPFTEPLQRWMEAST
ncbi:MAG: PD-(D/E)XK nuclease family protein [Rhodothermales bacterium]